MNKFNKQIRNFLKERRAKRTAARRQKGRPQLQQVVQVVSGKKQRKLDNKWRRAQKEVLETGLVTMEDIEMMVAESEKADGAGEASQGVGAASQKGKGRGKVPRKVLVHLKKRKVRVRIRGTGKAAAREQGSTEGATEADSMMVE
eukprot:TRINITY_DN1460_c0_g1_i1.p1 TRINITY_DN1460_c0_g1~~TRINITY_DN1460_c0_g1_i1.p1  ORF type:complete len:145 (-),score=46.01 TRINITY_DN1460_c0_g1_i1:153-587(-)